MTLPQLYEQVASLPSGGYLTVGTRYNKKYIYDLIHSARAVIVTNRWKSEGKIPPIYFQPFKPQFETLSQDRHGCFTRFLDVPDIIALDGRATGLGFIGGDGTLCMFREVSSKATFAAMQNHYIMKMGRNVSYALMLGGGEINVYSTTSIESMELQAVFSDPTQVNTYNVEYDSYPMDTGDIKRMEDMLMQGSMALTYKTPIDRVNDQRDTTVPPQVR